MFQDRIESANYISPHCQEVRFLPLEADMYMHSYPSGALFPSIIIYLSQQDFRFIPYIYDLEKNDEQCRFLTEKLPYFVLKEKLSEMNSEQQISYLHTLLMGFHQMYMHLFDSPWTLKCNPEETLVIADNDEIYISDPWNSFSPCDSLEEKQKDLFELIKDLQKIFECYSDILGNYQQPDSPEKIHDSLQAIIDSIRSQTDHTIEMQPQVSLKKHMCANHEEKEGEYRCRICHQFFCNDCIIFIKKYPLCESCLQNNPEEVQSFVAKIDQEEESQFDLLSKKYLKTLFETLMFNKTSLNRLSENTSFKETGILSLFYLVIVFSAFAHFSPVHFGYILLWKLIPILSFLIAGATICHFENPLLILFVLLLPSMATDIVLAPLGYFQVKTGLYISYLWSILIAISFFLNTLKIGIQEIFITWMAQLILMLVLGQWIAKHL